MKIIARCHEFKPIGNGPRFIVSRNLYGGIIFPFQNVSGESGSTTIG